MIKPFLVTLSLVLLLSGCDTCNKNDCVIPADPFKFSIIDRNNKEDLVFPENPLYHPDSIRLFYYQDEEEIDLPLQALTKEFHYTVLSNQTLPYISAIGIVKDFYLQFNYHDIDTMLIDVRQIDFECCTVFQYAQSYINGKILKRSQEDYTVFLIEK